MRQALEALDLSWPDVASAVEGLPELALLGATITILHRGRMIPYGSVRRGLKSWLGTPHTERKTWRAYHATWGGGRLPVQVRVRARDVRLQVTQKASPDRLRRAIRCLGTVPNLGTVQVKGRTSDSPAFSSSAAPSGRPGHSRRPGWMNGRRRFQ